jgi:mannose/fructose/N-acetylgalactosamine-specific phosphotransferase system component IIB
VPFLLVRVDDRLVHGQVSVAWGGWLDADRIILANDAVAASEWERAMYSEGDALGAAISVTSLSDFARAAAEGRWRDERVIVVVGSLADLLELLRLGVEVPEANVGGLHFSEGKREVLPYLYVDDEDVATMREIAGFGTRLVARDVPQAQAVDVLALIEGGGGSAVTGGSRAD